MWLFYESYREDTFCKSSRTMKYNEFFWITAFILVPNSGNRDKASRPAAAPLHSFVLIREGMTPQTKPSAKAHSRADE